MPRPGAHARDVTGIDFDREGQLGDVGRRPERSDEAIELGAVRRRP